MISNVALKSHSYLSGSHYLLKTFAKTRFLGIHSIIKCSYSSSSIKISRGDIVLYNGEFEGETGDVLQSKHRPHIVISADKVLEVTERVVLAPLSTAPVRFDFEIIIPHNETTGISRISKVVANQIRTGYLEDGFKKIGSAADYLEKINQALAISFSDNFKKDQKLEISRGDVVEIDFGKYSRTGVIISNDLGNRFSQIAMLAHSYHKGEGVNEFDLIVNKENDIKKETLLVQCYMINTFAQGFMDRKGKISSEDMERVTKMLFKTLGIE